MPAQETSVMVALSELHRIESERVATEKAQEAERRRKEAERLRREEEERKEAECHRLRVAEAEARLRVAEEVQAAAAVQRANRIEEELRSVKAEKAVLAEQIFARPSVSDRPDGLGFWRFVTAAILVGVGMAGVAVFTWQPKRPPPVIITERVPTPPSPSDDSAALKKQVDELEARFQKAMRDAASLHKAPVASRPKPTPAAKPKPVNLTPEMIRICETDPIGCLSLKK